MLTKFINVLVIIAAIVSLLLAGNALRVANETATKTDLAQIELEQTLAEMTSKLEDMQSQLDNIDVPDSTTLYQDIEEMFAEIDQRYFEVIESMYEW